MRQPIRDPGRDCLLLEGERKGGSPCGCLLQGSDEKAVRSLFHPHILRFFETQKDWFVEAGGEWLMVYRRGRKVEPWGMRGFLDEAQRVHMLFVQR